MFAALALTWACAGAAASELRHFLYTGSDELASIEPLLQRPDIEGVQIVYSWKSLEPEPGRYDFSGIEHDLAYLQQRKKQLFVQVQDRFFLPTARHIPSYLLTDPAYGGGLVRQSDDSEVNPGGSGWVAQQWNPALRQRFQALLAALAKQFDGRILGINLPETAIDIDRKRDKTRFSCDGYFNATLENMRFARQQFHRSAVVQYVNFWPCEWDNDHQYMSRTFATAAQEGIGLGGPDIVPWKKAQMKNAYPFFHQYKGKLSLVAMAVQEPTLRYVNPKTGKPFTRDQFVSFAQDYLGVDVMFWAVDSPWLRR
ncbi:hypothetical protein K6V18_20150 [Ralstonia insidiosa]|nr:hypothetical protein [Ralstonia insidiosa]